MNNYPNIESVYKIAVNMTDVSGRNSDVNEGIVANQYTPYNFGSISDNRHFDEAKESARNMYKIHKDEIEKFLDDWDTEHGRYLEMKRTIRRWNLHDYS